MGTVVLNGATSGATTLVPTDAVTATLTLPSATGTLLGSGIQIAFSAYSTTDLVVSTSTLTKVTGISSTNFNVSGGAYSTSNSRFTPTVAGYYFVYAFFEWGSSSSTSARDIYFTTQAGNYRRGQSQTMATGGNTQSQISGILYFNGSTDWVEVWAYQATGGNLSVINSNGQPYNCFEACLIRTA
jgi:hypothetical protein